MTDESPALALDAQRWLLELVHDPGTVLRVLASVMQKVSAGEAASLRTGGYRSRDDVLDPVVRCRGVRRGHRGSGGRLAAG